MMMKIFIAIAAILGIAILTGVVKIDGLFLGAGLLFIPSLFSSNGEKK